MQVGLTGATTPPWVAPPRTSEVRASALSCSSVERSSGGSDFSAARRRAASASMVRRTSAPSGPRLPWNDTVPSWWRVNLSRRWRRMRAASVSPANWSMIRAAARASRASSVGDCLRGELQQGVGDVGVAERRSLRLVDVAQHRAEHVEMFTADLAVGEGGFEHRERREHPDPAGDLGGVMVGQPRPSQQRLPTRATRRDRIPSEQIGGGRQAH